MNEMFTESARKAIEYARDEASRLKHDYIGTEHLLLGLIRLGEGQAIEVLANLGLEPTDLRASIEEVVQPSGGTMTMGRAYSVGFAQGRGRRRFASSLDLRDRLQRGLRRVEECPEWSAFIV